MRLWKWPTAPDAVAASAIHQPDWTLMAGLWQGLAARHLRRFDLQTAQD
ncbi:MAG: hypothetical protein HYY23_07395 [Verrucomicrobia bacterium]|nr:hypothetical protein [Verrucomicrobiota bacterium]